MMTVLPLLAVLGVLVWIIDRILLRLELRGWITYRRMPRVKHAYGSAALGIDALLQPDRRHVIELKQDAEMYREEDDEAGKARRRKLKVAGRLPVSSTDNDDTAGNR